MLVDGLCKSYDGSVVLDNIHLQIDLGERVAVMGPSGSGKSTLLNCLSGILPFDCGSIRFQERQLAGLTDDDWAKLRRESIGFIFQDFHLLPTLSAAENIEFPLLLQKMARKERKERVASLLDEVGLSHRAHADPATLSGGERQRVAIARALITYPSILFADEPTGSLDALSGNRILKLLENLSHSYGISVLMATHDPEAARSCHRILRLKQGWLAETHWR